MKKNLNKNSILYATLHLIDANGETTTMEVKNRLRAEGFFAKQKEVSETMNDFVEGMGLSYSDNGQYRTYSFGSTTNKVLGFVMCDDVDDFFAKMATGANTTPQATAPVVKAKTTTRLDEVVTLRRGTVVLMTTTPKPGDYVVRHGATIRYFRSNGINSNQAKSAFCAVDLGGLTRGDIQSVTRV